MSELKSIVEAYEVALRQGETVVIATVMNVVGSAYRHPGARMLIRTDGSTVGAISGGCLERDVCEHSMNVRRTGKAVVVRYDTTSDADIVWGLGLGCNGIVHVLIEPLPAKTGTMPAHITLLAGTLNRHERGVIATIFNDTSEAARSIRASQIRTGSRTIVRGDGSVISEITDAELAAAIEHDAYQALAVDESGVKMYERTSGTIEVFLEVVRPPVPLVIFGASQDAVTVATFAKKLGWHVTIVDTRARAISRDRFAEADAVLLCRPEDVNENIALTQRTMTVVMTHNYLHDLELLRRLLPSPARYIGVLGPKRRTERIVSEAMVEDLVLDNEQLSKLYAPIGLDIGADTPEEIALSIVAEIKAVLAGRAGGLLRNRKGSIHGGVSDDNHLSTARLQRETVEV